ncbi:MAG: hypothetical protein JW720_00755 [Sedimentisphaerales bacterium]|nr:hypothetical protein [Sedimentisphaerales bacterium]
MARNYSPKTFLRQTPNRILKGYFARKNLLGEVDFDALGKMEIDPILEAVSRLPKRDNNGIEADFAMAYEMACEKGVELLMKEARFPIHNLDLSGVLENMENHYETALWFLMSHPNVFNVAYCFDFMDRIGSWKRRYVGEGRAPAVEEKAKNELARAISAFYKKTQGRGRHCRVDNYLRDDPERHCYFAYPEDYATTDMGYDESGQFTHWPRRSAFEVIFVYRPQSGSLEICAKGSRKDIDELQWIFCSVILSMTCLPDETGKRFNLAKLKNKDFDFVNDTKDGIEKVTIKMLRLDLPGKPDRRITLEASSPNAEQTIHTLIDRALKKSDVGYDEMVVSRAKLQFKFAPKDGKRGKTLTFDISLPDRWTLKDDPADQIAKKYIEQWGLASG